ncbi:MAG: ATP-binding protein, partial [Chloroflexi bacterium]|nr:ATP-binding protein [Chloroflexota bacterium]
ADDARRLAARCVTAVAEEGGGRLWIGTYAGLQCWQEGGFIQDAAEPFRSPLPVTRLLVDRAGTVWMVVNGQLRQVEAKRLITPKLVGEPSGQLAISALHEGRSGQLWLGGNSGYVASSSNGVLRVLRLPDATLPDNIWEVWEARNGDVWMGTASSGLRRWRNDRVLTLTTQEGLAENSVRCLFEDREGNLWVGTNGGGLQRLKPKTLRLVTTREGLAHNVVMSLAEDASGELWIGSNCGGLSARRKGAFAPAYLNYLLDNECIWSVLTARDGALWFGTWSSGLFRKSGEKLEQFKLTNSPSDEPVLALCEDRAGGMWVGTYQDGLKFFRDGKFTSYRATDGLSANFVTALAQDASNRLWIGTAGGGLNCFADGVFKVFTRQDGLGSDFIRTLYIDADGVLWIGTGGGGLSRIKDARLATISTRQGLVDDVISQILEDDRGHLWFGSNRGIFHVSKAELDQVAEGRVAWLNPIAYGKADGMENLECTGGFCPAGLKTRDGRLWFSTVKGLVMIDPENLPGHDLPPPVVIEQVVVNGVPAAVDAKRLTSQIQNSKLDMRNSQGLFASTATTLRIGPRARRVELRYTALSFTAPEKVRFRYRLDGLDSDWVEAEGRRVAEYSFLPPGQYRFRVTACNEDGVWSESEAGLALTCLPAPWQTWWFRLLVAAMVLGGAGWAVKFWATRRLQRRLTLLQQQHALEQERTRIARDIHDELGASLTEISLLSDHGQKRLDRPGEVEVDLERISTTAREAVQTADGIVWAVNPRNDSLDHLANYLVHFAEDFFRLTTIRCYLDVPADLPQIPLSTQHRHHLLLAVKEACNNVVRHSEASEVWLRMTVAEKQFSITVEDNGKGFRVESAPEGSDGLVNMRQRMADLGGCLELSSGPGRGTRVKLIAPLNQFNQFTCPSA